jgi:hypothetical protein
VFLVNSRHRHFSATTFGSRSKSFHLMVAHLLPKLRCHFAEFLNQGSLERLGILSPPTCVGLRYDHLISSLEAFLGSVGLATLCPFQDSSSLLGVKGVPDLPKTPAYQLESRIPTREWPTLLRPPITQMLTRWYRNINLFSIAYAFQPRLRGRLTLSGLTLLRKP